MANRPLCISALVALSLLAPATGWSQDNATETSTAAAPAPKKAKKKKRSNGNPSAPAPVRDSSIESQFHQTYLKYNSQPTSEEVWSGAVAEKNANTYQTQSGDTLWDISNTLFADPYFWPKIWSLNTQTIGNPHEISPNTTLVFIPGTVTEPPAVVAEETPAAAPAAPAKAAESDEEESEDGVKAVASKPVLQQLPESLPALRFFRKPPPPTQVELDLKTPRLPSRQEKLSYVLSDTDITSDGKIVEAEAGMKSAASYQHVYIKFNDKPQKKYYIYKELSSVKSPYKFFYSGDLIEMQGEVEVLEQVNVSKNIYRAIVTYTETAIEVGSLVKAGSMPTFLVDGGESNRESFARVIGAQYARDRKVIGNANLIFLDGGSGDGFRVGQTVNISEDYEIREPGTDVTDSDTKIATARIVNVNSKFTTAYILKSNREVEVGDYTGPKKDHQRTEAGPKGSSDAINEGERSGRESSLAGGGKADDENLDLDSEDGEAPKKAPAKKPSDEGMDDGESLDDGSEPATSDPTPIEEAPTSDSGSDDFQLD